MTFKKERAGIAAMLLLSQLVQMVFVINVAIVKNIPLKKGLLTFGALEIGFVFALVVASFIGYYWIPIKKHRDIYAIVFFSLGAVSWLITLFRLWKIGALAATEAVFVLLMCVLLGICCASHVFLAPRKEKGRWLSFRLAESVATIVMLAAAFFALNHYHNELLSPLSGFFMFILCAVCLLSFLWLPEEINLGLTIAVILGQAISYVVCFAKICKSPDLLSLTGVLFQNRTRTQILSALAMSLLAFLAVAMLLHYFKNLQIIGKYASIAATFLVVCGFLILSGIKASAENALDVDVNETMLHAEYSLYVMKDDAAQSLEDVKSYRIGYATEDSESAMREAVAKIQDLAGGGLDLVRYDYLGTVADALYAGEIQAVLIDTTNADMIDMGFSALGLSRVFTSDTRAILSMLVDYVDEGEIPNPDITDPEIDPGYDPFADPSIWGDPEDPTPTPIGWKEGDPTPTPDPSAPTPTKKPTKVPGTPTPKPTVMPYKEHSSSSDLDVANKPFLVYISGIDRYGAITVRSRSDVNLLAAVNPNTHEIMIVTTPRDAYVHIPGKTSSMRDKLTHAGNYGPSYSIATLENLYGVKVDFYVRVNFSSVEKIVNLLGGVDVNSHYTFTDVRGLYTFQKGVNHLNGAQALVFARERKNIPTGDVARGVHHTELLRAVINKMTSTTVLNKYQSLLNSLTNNLQTDISLSQIASLVSKQLGDGASWKVSSYATSGTGSMQYCASYRSTKLWVSLLHSSSVKEAASLLNKTLGR